jgi:plasmid stabilization system protein ParE
MALTLQFSDEARQELLSAIDYYEDKQKGLGLRFNKVVNQTINNIVAFPKSFPVIYGNKRKATVKHYPYVVIYEYEVKDGVLYILSIFHTRQDPSIWKGRK